MKSILTLIVCCLLWQTAFGAPAKEIRRVLLIYELGVSSPAVALADREIRSALEKSRYQIEIYSEYLETTLFPDEATQQKFREWYIQKYQERKPDLVIVGGSSAIRFIVGSHETFFQNTPVVFCGGAEGLADNPIFNSHFAGVWGVIEPEQNLKLVLQLFPSTKHVAVVGGIASSDKYVAAIVREHLRGYEGKLDFMYLTDLAMPELLERLKRLPRNTVILSVGLSRDAAGTRFISSTQSDPMMTAVANAPLFTWYDVSIGRGAVGGYVTSFAAQGRVAGEMAVRILNGEKPQDVPVVKGTNVYMFDWRVLQRWGLEESKLPPGSIVINRQPTAWESYKQYIVAAILLCLAETLLLFGLLWQRAERKKVEQSLVERLTFESLVSDLSTILINLPEERLASNIEEHFRRMAEFLKMERITIHEFSRDRTELMVTFSWSAEGVPYVPTVVKISQFPWWRERLLRGEAVLVSDSNALPREAFREKEHLRELQALSLASIPLEAGGEVIGLLSFSTMKHRVVWTEDLVKQLRAFADIFSNALRRKNNETVLRESEERLRLAAHVGRMYAYDWDVKSDTVARSKEAANILGFDEATVGLTRHRLLALVHPDDRALFTASVGELTPDDPNTQISYRVLRPDGSLVWLEKTGHAFFDEQGNMVRMIGMVADVTERKLAEEALSGVNGKLIEAQERERTHIARELHDDINQRIALVAVELEVLKQNYPELADATILSRIDDSRKRLFDIGIDIQAMSHRLHSSKLEYLGIVVAAKGFCKEFSEQQKLEIEFTHNNIPPTLPPDISLCLFRVLQEGLHNAAKYSGARRFEARLRGIPGKIELTIRDFGRGFDPEAAINSRGLGLISMRERVSSVNGTISISSKPTCGTEINVRVPSPADECASQMNLTRESVTEEYGASADLASR